MKKIIVLDSNSGKSYVFDFDVDSFNFSNMQEFFDEVHMAYGLGLIMKDCQWMITDKINIEIL